MFRSLEIANFKGIRAGQLEDLAQVNLLVGRNNSGKSTVLEALVLLRAAFRRPDLLGQDGTTSLLKRRVSRDASTEELWFRRDTSNIVSVVVHLDRGGTVHVENSYKVNRVVIGTPSGTAEHPHARLEGKHFFNYADRVIPEFRALVSNLLLVDPAYLRQPVGENIWEHVVENRHDIQVVTGLNQAYGLNMQGISYMPFGGQHRLLALLPERAVPFDWFGDGVRYTMAVLSVAVLLADSALLIEELESHQHPEALKKTVGALFQLAKTNRTQLFLTTHSMELIAYALETAEATGLTLKLYHCALSADGEFKARGISAPDTKVLADVGPDPRSLYKYVAP